MQSQFKKLEEIMRVRKSCKNKRKDGLAKLLMLTCASTWI